MKEVLKLIWNFIFSIDMLRVAVFIMLIVAGIMYLGNAYTEIVTYKAVMEENIGRKVVIDGDTATIRGHSFNVQTYYLSNGMKIPRDSVK